MTIDAMLKPNNPWDLLELDGVAAPARVAMSVLEDDEETLPADFSAKFYVTDQNSEAVRDYLQTVMSPLGTRPVRAVHPALQAYRVSKVLVMSQDAPEWAGHDAAGRPVHVVRVHLRAVREE